MKLTYLEVGRFGVWRDLSLPLTSSELNVIFGPNEAGKTTLMRFLRGMLFGFSRGDSIDAAEPPRGVLEVEHHGQTFRLERTGTAFSVAGAQTLAGEQAEAWLTGALGNVTRDVFDNVCCFGLEELQQLSVLTGEQIVEKLFGVSLGHKGRFILQALKDAESKKQELTSGTAHKRSIRHLLADHDRLGRELDELGNPKERLAKLRREAIGLDDTIDELQSRRDDLDAQRRAQQFLARLHGPWRQVQDLEAKLEQIPEVQSFPENGLARLDEIEAELQTREDERSQLQGVTQRLDRQLTDMIDADAAIRMLPAVRVLLKQADELQLRQSADGPESEEKLEESLTEKLSATGDGWSRDRLDRLDLSPSRQQELSRAARAYENSLKNRSKARRKIEKDSKWNQKEQQELEQQSRNWQGQSARQMLERTERQIKNARDGERLTLRAEQIEERLSLIEEQRTSLTEAEPLPKGVQYLLTGFTVCGAILAALGIWRGVGASGLAGAVYFLLGLTCGGLGLALKWHFSTQQGDRLQKLDDEEQELRKLQADVKQRLEFLEQDESSSDLTALTGQLRTYQRWIDRDEVLQNRRRKASQLRARLQELCRDVSRDRDHWVKTLREAGLDETVRIREGWANWQSALELKEIRHQIEALQNRHSVQSEMQRLIETSVRDVQEKIDGHEAFESSHSILKMWRTRIVEWENARRRKEELTETIEDVHSQVSQLDDVINDLEARRTQLLIVGGAKDRQAFDRRFQWYQERHELLELLEVAREELDDIIQAEPGLAIVEEDLLNYEEAAVRRRLEELGRDLAHLEEELSAAYERRGQVRQERDTLLKDRRESRLRQRLVEVEEQIKDHCERWLGIDRAEQAVSHIKFKLERDNRPETLQRAERYFRMLTGGRYQRVWAPLGEHDLHVEDHAGLALRLNELSGGTREQLLLSLRLALVEEQRANGIHLPFILDDILVNFDEARVASAMETLIEFSRQGTQTILLTCHARLADALREHHVPVTQLPERINRIERLAG